MIQPPVLTLFQPPVVQDLLLFLNRKGKTNLERFESGRWKKALVRPGHIAITAPGDTHSLRWRGTESRQATGLIVPQKVLRSVLQDLKEHGIATRDPQSRLSITDHLLESSILALRRALLNGMPDLYAETAAQFIAMHCLMNHAVTYRRMPDGGEAQRMALLEEYIRAHWRRNLSLEELARITETTKFRLIRLCQKYWKTTPMERVQRIRLEHGRKLLTETTLTVEAISQDCGYRNPSHFATAFRRCYSTSPTQFRSRQH